MTTDRGDPETAWVLVKAGADSSTKDIYGETPLHY